MEALFHLLVPTMAALAAGFERKKVLTLALLTVLPDIDHAIVYRAFLHNVFFLLLAAAVVHAVKKDREMAFLAAFFIGSHLLFDIGGGIAALYPLDDGYYSLQSRLVGKAGHLPRFESSFFRSGSEEWRAALYEKLSSVERVWASTEMLMVIILLLAAILFVSRKNGARVVVGVSTHNPESPNHRALRHHPPNRKGAG